MRRVVIFLFDDAEDLDFVGPLEVFGAFGAPGENTGFQVVTVSAQAGPIKTRNGLRIQPDFTFADCPKIDVLLIPGGIGTRPVLEVPSCIAWIRQAAQQAEIVLTVCTGSLLAAKAGLLEGLEATTHFAAMELLEELAPGAKLRPGSRYLDNGKYIIAAGVSAGIDASLHLLGRLHGRDKAAQTARYIEYEYFKA